MAKVYRLHGGQDGTGWFTSKPITNEQLSSIKTAGAEVATSIPSPFARIDLVKSAFQWVANNGLDGSNAQHKLVSDALDVAQLFFLYPKHRDKIKIISWSPRDRFENLIENADPKHAAFVKTLQIFWEQDGEVYNFDQVQKLYFLLNNSNQVIGGTSPATLFFAAPDVKQATEDLNITIAHDILFDDKFCSLADRNKSFVEYIFTLSKQPNFANFFPEVYSYLQVVLTKLKPEHRIAIAGLTANNLENFPPCPVLDNEMNPCEVLGIRLGVQVKDSSLIAQESDFLIQNELEIDGLKPLILPNDIFAHTWVYSAEGVLWNSNNKIPSKNMDTPENSRLPIQGDHYYWLSIDNFLEDKIIELPYSIDSIKFKIGGAKKHLLPLKPSFFEYFKAENVSKYINISVLAGGGVEVKLDIPVKRGKITFKKTYHQENIVKMELHLAVLPFLRTSNMDLDYTLALQDDRFDKNKDIFIECFEESKKSILSNPIVRKQGSPVLIKSTYYKSKKFDAIRLRNGSYSGFIVPSMQICGENQQVSFAIDFGTTNTHIEYKHGSNVAKAIDITSDLPIWQSLLDRNEKDTDPAQIANDNNFEREIFPYQFNSATNYKFPFRTALTYNETADFAQLIEVFTHTNNYFLFEKLFQPRYLQLHTKLKWSNYTHIEEKILVEKYVECLIFIVLYKTLLLNGNPNTSIIRWFYPVSMDAYEQGIFFEVWQKAYEKIFNIDNSNNIKAMPESIAPYLHYRTMYPGLSLSIDIGGGSSDIAVFKNAKDLPEFISSFKFAGNAIFGDGFPNGAFSNTLDYNGFVESYKASVKKAIFNNPNKEAILGEIEDSSDFSSFLFSLEKEPEIVFNYTDLLRQDRKMKLPIFVFYAAIIYYSANLIKKQGITQIPDNILLSGTAAKTIKILDAHEGFPKITGLFKFMFNHIMGTLSNQINVVLAENPKEITCKGALKADNTGNITDCPIAFWLGGNDDSVWGKALNKSTDIPKTPFYRDLEHENNKSLIENSIQDFFKLLDDYVMKVNFEGDFGIDSSAYQKFREMRSSNILNYLEIGLKAFYKSPDKPIEETLFFYPLIGIMNKLAFELSNTNKQ